MVCSGFKKKEEIMLNQIREQRERMFGRIFVEENLKLNKLDKIFSLLSRRYNVDYNTIADLIQTRENYINVPVELFNNTLTPLENIVFFLDEIHSLSQTEISKLLKRNHTTVWITLNKAFKKMSRAKFRKLIDKINKDINVPVEIFANRKLSSLEAISTYMKDNMELRYNEIAKLLGKDDRTIWTVVNRAKKKTS